LNRVINTFVLTIATAACTSIISRNKQINNHMAIHRGTARLKCFQTVLEVILLVGLAKRARSIALDRHIIYPQIIIRNIK